MKTILGKIVEDRRAHVNKLKELVNIQTVESTIDFSRKVNSLKDSLLESGSSGIIAEFKRRSPSKGVINNEVAPAPVVKAYWEAGATGSSVLTEPLYFGGSDDDLKAAKSQASAMPILRKDFIVDEYQVVESRAIGADVILLIAAVLSKEEVSNLTTVAHKMGLEVLLELHDESEIDKIDARVDMIGINNRNLKDFTVDITRAVKLAGKLPAEIPKVAESGISKPETVDLLRKSGFSGFLIGECFMKEENPGVACMGFIKRLRQVCAG